MTDHDFNGNESVIPYDIEYTLSRIGTIADSVDSSMTVGEIVRRAYLCGVGTRWTSSGSSSTGGPSSIPPSTGAIAIDEIGAMVYRDGRIASMLTHPALDRPVRRDLEFPSVAEAESR